ncbi:teichoic acid D-Ala incorporation-associated protein DltX [Sporosarcina sp. Te-1]|nr:teichoic acid D-Ala incorporation-associated protein DltX [Sporosarcina sp. Te-1]QTD41872.1 teichoic acid D-Ala incorporation-associated protein DltX [Sporosarcina sp. Te-1]
MQSIKWKEQELFRFIGLTMFYFIILVLLFLIHGFHDMDAGAFIYTEF